jgi:hypothetical protein
MKKLIFRLVFPLTFISYMIFEKWWYVLVFDGPDKTVYGFPLINCSQSFATSLQFYYYVFETVVNITVFSLFWFAIIFIFDKYIKPITISKLFAKISIVLLCFYLIGFTYFSIELDNQFFIKRDFEVKVIDKGYHFIWTDFKPNYSKINVEQGK